MKALVIAGVAGSLLLAGCGSSEADEAPTSSEPTATSGLAAWKKNAESQTGFVLAGLRKLDIKGLREGPAIDNIENTCGDLQQGADHATVVKRVQGRFTDDAGNQQLSKADAEKVIGLATKYICPDQS